MLKFFLFYLWLRPLIWWNYELRKAGVLPDAWYWADRLALSWGYFIKRI